MDTYKQHVMERAAQNIPPLPLDAARVEQIVAWLQEGRTTSPDGEFDLVNLLENRVPAGVDPAAKIKCDYLAGIVSAKPASSPVPPAKAVAMLGDMQGGYTIPVLVDCLKDDDLGADAAQALSTCILAADAVEPVADLAAAGNPHAKRLLESWATAEWFTGAPALPAEIKLIVYRVEGEVNTDDLSPAKQAPTRPDIPLHALALGETRFPGGLEQMQTMRAEAETTGFSPVFVADTLGTGSSRKSAINSLVWVLGRDVPHQPNKREGGVVLAARIAPIFYNSFEDAGGLPLMADVSSLKTGDRIVVRLDRTAGTGRIERDGGGEVAAFTFPRGLADEYRAGSRINLIIGRKLSTKAAAILGLPAPEIFVPAVSPKPAPGQGYTLAQKLVGRACGKDGVLPGESCEPAMSTVGSQDTTGPMTRDELNNLACLSFTAPMVMQSFCHTAAYPTDRDKTMQATLPAFIQERGGVALKPGDGIVHSWLNRLLLPDRVGTGGDSHTRFPLGISFAAGSGLVALAAAMGFMPIEMPESVLVSFSGTLSEGITLRDVVNAIPLLAVEQGLLDRPGTGNKNVFNGRIMEMEGLPGLTVEEAFELACATAERSAAASTVALDVGQVAEYLRSNVKLIESMLQDGYQSAAALENRKAEMEKWLENPSLTRRDDSAEFAATVPIDLSSIREPVLATPNNPDLVAWMSEEAGKPVDEVFIGSCMSNIGHFRAAARLFMGPKARLGVKRLWIVAPTRMDHDRLASEGVLQCFEKLGARLEIPGCSLCMGNQARVEDNAVVFSTSTRNFNNRMGAGAQVYLGSGILAAVVARLGKIPAPDEYFRIYREEIAPHQAELLRPMYFHREG
ncbi:MAG: bifunctional aconitate hydratase 2/2-methylisocitrate dehydratase [Planctomycetaceae bacterium]|nr:bifunctional aconitate hydratase 2/2-methylisocitrate dehydratase [Planctomycetaceae bacterium]